MAQARRHSATTPRNPPCPSVSPPNSLTPFCSPRANHARSPPSLHRASRRCSAARAGGRPGVLHRIIAAAQREHFDPRKSRRRHGPLGSAECTGSPFAAAAPRDAGAALSEARRLHDLRSAHAGSREECEADASMRRRLSSRDIASSRSSSNGMRHAGRRVSGLIMDGEKPSRVPDQTIAEIRARELGGLVRLPWRLQPGDQVHITRGVFADVGGLFVGQLPRERVLGLARRARRLPPGLVARGGRPGGGVISSVKLRIFVLASNLGEERSLGCSKLVAVITARKQVPIAVHCNLDSRVPHALLHHLGRQF